MQYIYILVEDVITDSLCVKMLADSADRTNSCMSNVLVISQSDDPIDYTINYMLTWLKLNDPLRLNG